MNKQNQLKKEMKQNCISIKTFLMNYYGIYNEELMKNKVTHKIIKTLLPHVKRISFNNLLEKKESLYNGSVVSVIDCNGEVLPYVNPYLNNLGFIDNVEYSIKDIQEDKLIEEIVIDSNLSSYELSVLCKRLKVLNRMREYRIAYRLLKKLKQPKSKEYMLQKKYKNIK